MTREEYEMRYKQFFELKLKSIEADIQNQIDCKEENARKQTEQYMKMICEMESLPKRNNLQARQELNKIKQSKAKEEEERWICY